MTSVESVWVDFNARERGFCYVPQRRFDQAVAVGDTVVVYDPEDCALSGAATVKGFDLDRGRVFLEVDWDSFEVKASESVSPGRAPEMSSFSSRAGFAYPPADAPIFVGFDLVSPVGRPNPRPVVPEVSPRALVTS